MGVSFKPLFKYLLIFLLTVVVLTSALVGIAVIPKENVQDHLQDSAKYLCERSSYFNQVENMYASRIDRYADSILLSIAYYIDSEHPLASVLWAKYYGTSSQIMNEFFLESVTNNPPPNMEYLRYWHGSLVLVRFLHQFFSIRTIYILNGCLITGLFLILFHVLLRNRLFVEALSLLFSLIAVGVWFVPFSLEYTWVFLILPVVSILSVHMAQRKQYDRLGALFLLAGMVTVYLDFLSAETLTLLVPLLLVLRIRVRSQSSDWDGENWRLAVQWGLLWLAGYCGMWAAKWALATVFLGENVMPYVTGHIEERINGDMGFSLPVYLGMTLIRNFFRLFPWDYGIIGAVVFALTVLIFFFLPIYRNQFKRKATVNKSRVFLYASIGLLPYFRFLVLHNHAYRHYYFSYRAQAATVLALCFLLLELIEPVPNKKGGLRFGKSS